ncbi:uncharacterized protein [Anabrus simplex]|uniref:uncharacterized protein n=1 Tax=Anabrus simplex TaxID=316456 RepID=UPI0035A2970B
MEQLDAAEKEASEVLHSLLSVEKIEKHALPHDDENQVVVVTSEPDIVTDCQDQSSIQWHHGPVMFANMVGGNPGLQGEQVIWQLNHTSLTAQQHGTICIPTMHSLQTLGEDHFTTQTPSEPAPVVFTAVEKEKSVNKVQSSGSTQKSSGQKKKQQQQQQTQQEEQHQQVQDGKSTLRAAPLTLLEENAQQVRERFERGCECQEENCFKGLSPEYVYRHRLNIAELTKGEHDMYLMGVTMAVLTNPDETVRHKERRRLRAQYVFQGRRVCLDAFLYLENCTHYQLKRIRKHVMTHGVAPRVHGNHGKKPHNTFPLTSYRHAALFLRQFIEQHVPGATALTHSSTPIKGKSKSNNKTAPIYLPSEITRKTIHNAYREHCEKYEPSIKIMGYSTFRQYMKEQFAHVRFSKLDSAVSKLSNSSSNVGNLNNSSANFGNVSVISNVPSISNNFGSVTVESSGTDITDSNQQQNPVTMEVEIVSQQNPKIPDDGIIAQTIESHHETQPTTMINSASDVQQVTAIPIVLSQPSSQPDAMVQTGRLSQSQQEQQQTTYIVTPVSQILQSPMNQAPSAGNGATAYASYQLTPATPSSYAAAQHIAPTQVGTITVTNSQAGTYAFTTL